MVSFLEFEKPVAELEARIVELRATASVGDINIDGEIATLEQRAAKLLIDTYAKLTPWQKTQVARHPERPHFKHYVAGLFDEFVPLAGDRAFGDDQAIIGGFAMFRGRRVMVIGHEKGDDTASRLRHNFGMGKPEGYRKAIRLVQLADRFGLPIVTLVDTSGAFPGIQAEERGQAEAIAKNLMEMAVLTVPILVVVIGEGASGGALGIGVGDRLLMMENTWFSVISPEGCASILWRDASKAEIAADAMKVTAQDLHEMGICDEIIPEPLGGAHKDYDLMSDRLKNVILKQLVDLSSLDSNELIDRRIAKYDRIGVWEE